MTHKTDITPAHLRCSYGGCPSVHVLEDGKLEITGELLHVHSKAAGLDEATVVIPEAYFADIPSAAALRRVLETQTRISDEAHGALLAALADNERLREALKPFAKAADGYDLDAIDGESLQGYLAADEITIGDLRQARAALEATAASPAPLTQPQATTQAGDASASPEPTSEVTGA